MQIEIRHDTVVFYESNGCPLMEVDFAQANFIMQDLMALGDDVIEEKIIERMLLSRNGFFSVEKS